MRFAAALAGHGLPWPAFCIGFSFWGSPPCFPRFPYFPTPRLPYSPLARFCAPRLSFRPAFPRRLFRPRRPFSSVPVGVRLPPRPLPPASGFLAPPLARGFYFDRLPRFLLSCPRLPPLPPRLPVPLPLSVPPIPPLFSPSISGSRARSLLASRHPLLPFPFALDLPSLLAFYVLFQLSRPPFSSLIPGRGSCFPSALLSALLLPSPTRGFLPRSPLFRFHSRPPFRLYPAALSPSVFTFAVPRSRSLLAPSHPLLSFLYPPSLRALRFSVRLPQPLPSRLFRPLFPLPSHPTSPLFQPAAGIRKHIVQPGKMCYTIPMNIHGLVPRTSIAEKGARRR